MNETRPVAEAGSAPVEPLRSRAALIWLLLPFAVLALAVTWLVAANPLSRFDNGAPPVENLTFERTVLSDSGIDLLVRAGGSEPMTISQVQVDDAYWQFVQEPTGPLGRGETAWIRLPYPWVLGEAHAVKMITNTGATFEHEIAVAVPTPVANAATLWSQMLLGAFVG
ncbi:MAG: metal transporter, partial [Verrucomicrobiae bacterium]|nr:metal transporter [Verrucomicrobiae bacterium]